MNYLFQPQRYNFISTIMNKVLSNASSASCWMVKLDLPILCLSPFSRPLTRCCVATAVLLDGYRHTLWLTCQKQKMLLTTIVTLPYQKRLKLFQLPAVKNFYVAPINFYISTILMSASVGSRGMSFGTKLLRTTINTSLPLAIAVISNS